MSAASHRRREVALAGHLGDELTARAALVDADGMVRATALTAVARLGTLTADDVRAATGDPEPRVRARAAEAAVSLPSAVDAHRSLALLLGDPDPTVVEVAAWACGEVDAIDLAIVSTLSTLAGTHEDALVREAAVAALGAIGHADGLAAILAATGDKPAIRRRAVLALAPFDGPDVDAALERATHDRDWQVRQAAEDLLSE